MQILKVYYNILNDSSCIPSSSFTLHPRPSPRHPHNATHKTCSSQIFLFQWCNSPLKYTSAFCFKQSVTLIHLLNLLSRSVHSLYFLVTFTYLTSVTFAIFAVILLIPFVSGRSSLLAQPLCILCIKKKKSVYLATLDIFLFVFSQMSLFRYLQNCYDSVKLAWKGGNPLLQQIALLRTTFSLSHLVVYSWGGTQACTFKDDKPGIQAGILCLLNLLARIVSFGSFQPLTVCIGDFPSFLLALTSNNTFIIKMWPGGSPEVVVRTMKIINLFILLWA